MSKCTRVAFVVGLVGLIWLLAGLAASGDIVARTGTSSLGSEPATGYTATINVGGKRLVGCPNVWYEEQLYGLSSAGHGRIGGAAYHGIFNVDGPLCVSERDLYRHSVVGLQAYRFEGLPFGRAYTIALGFCEPSEHVAVGDRVFDVLVNGELLLKDFDICKETRACHTAFVVTRVITLADTTTWLQLDFRRNVGSLPPVLSHIGVFEITGDPLDAATKTPTPSSTPSATPTPTETPASGSLPTIILAQITDTVDCPCDVTGHIQITTSGEEPSGPVSITFSAEAPDCDPIQAHYGPELEDLCGIPLAPGLTVSIPYSITMGNRWVLPTTITVSAHISSLCNLLTDVVTSAWDVGPANFGFDEGVTHWQAYKEYEAVGPTEIDIHPPGGCPVEFDKDEDWYLLTTCLSDSAEWRDDIPAGKVGIRLGVPFCGTWLCTHRLGSEPVSLVVTRQVMICPGVSGLDAKARLWSKDRIEANGSYHADLFTVSLKDLGSGALIGSQGLHKDDANEECWDSGLAHFHIPISGTHGGRWALLSLVFTESGNNRPSVGYLDDLRLAADLPTVRRSGSRYRLCIPWVSR